MRVHYGADFSAVDRRAINWRGQHLAALRGMWPLRKDLGHLGRKAFGICHSLKSQMTPMTSCSPGWAIVNILGAERPPPSRSQSGCRLWITGFLDGVVAFQQIGGGVSHWLPPVKARYLSRMQLPDCQTSFSVPGTFYPHTASKVACLLKGFLSLVLERGFQSTLQSHFLTGGLTRVITLLAKEH